MAFSRFFYCFHKKVCHLRCLSMPFTMPKYAIYDDRNEGNI